AAEAGEGADRAATGGPRLDAPPEYGGIMKQLKAGMAALTGGVRQPWAGRGMRNSRRAFLATMCGAGAAALAGAARPKRPNIVFILADDMGYGDVACFNPES